MKHALNTHPLSRLIAYAFNVVALLTVAVGVFEGAWFGGFGLVMFFTSLICTLVFVLGAPEHREPSESLTVRSDTPPTARAAV